MSTKRKKKSDKTGSNKSSRKRKSHASFKIETLEPRILLSATWIDTDTGNDIAGATGGNDTFTGTAGDDVEDGLAGNDILNGLAGSDILTGGDGNDLLDGGAGNDQLFGGTGDDIMISGGGTDQMFGGDGDDTFQFTGAQNGDQISVNGDGGVSDTIDLSTYSNANLTDNGSKITVDQGGGQSFEINYQGIEQIITSDGTYLPGKIGLSGTATVGGTPTAVDDAVTTDEDTAITTGDVTANDTDPDGDTLSVTGFTQANNGTVADNGDGTFTYTPNADFNGNDSFTYTVDDGNGGTDTATVNVTVNAVGDAPTAVDDTITTNEDTAVTTGDVTVNDTDPDGDALSVTGFTQANNGTVVDNSDGTFTYTADANYNGTDSFTYTVDDGNGNTDTATVNVTVNAVDDAPTAIAGVDQTLDEGSVVTLDATGSSDLDGDNLTYIWTQTGGPTVTLDNTSAVQPTFTAPDVATSSALTFQVQVSDGTTTVTDDVQITVDPTNQPNMYYFDELNGGAGFDTFNDMATSYQQYVNNADGVITINDLAEGEDLGTQYQASDGVWFSGTAGGKYGSYSGARAEDGAFAETITGYDGSYMPDGDDVYLKFNNDDPSNPFTINFDTPVSSVGAFIGTGVQGQDHTLTVRAYDANDNLITERVVNTQLWETNSSNQNYEGFFAIDADSASISKVEILNSSNVEFANALLIDNITWSDAGFNNKPPDAVDDLATTFEDTAITTGNVLANDTDPDGDTLTINAFTQADNGTVVNNDDGTFTYTPDANFNGSDSFTYTVDDGNGNLDTATVNVTVSAVNDGPVAVNDAVTTSEDSAITTGNVLANDTDVEGDALSITGFSQGSNGTVADNGDGTFTYTPNANYSGDDSFTYTVDDGNGGTNTATVDVTIAPVQDAPITVDDVVTTDENTAVITGNVMANDSDPDGDALTITGFTQGANGTVVDNGDGTFTYSPNANSSGDDSFTYTVDDGNGGTSVGTVNVTVNAVQSGESMGSGSAGDVADSGSPGASHGGDASTGADNSATIITDAVIQTDVPVPNQGQGGSNLEATNDSPDESISVPNSTPSVPTVENVTSPQETATTIVEEMFTPDATEEAKDDLELARAESGIIVESDLEEPTTDVFTPTTDALDFEVVDEIVLPTAGVEVEVTEPFVPAQSEATAEQLYVQQVEVKGDDVLPQPMVTPQADAIEMPTITVSHEPSPETVQTTIADQKLDDSSINHEVTNAVQYEVDALEADNSDDDRVDPQSVENGSSNSSFVARLWMAMRGLGGLRESSDESAQLGAGHGHAPKPTTHNTKGEGK